jgi:hypothetical protein
MGTLSVLTVPIQLVTHTVSVLTGPAIFWFVVRRIVHCNTGPLKSVVAGKLAILACLNPCHIKPYWSCRTQTCNLLIHSQTHCLLRHRASEITCGRPACNTSLSKSLPHKILLILAWLEPAIFWFIVRRTVHCATGPLTSDVAGHLAILACLNPCHIKSYWSWQDSKLKSSDS